MTTSVRKEKKIQESRLMREASSNLHFNLFLEKFPNPCDF
jgi:hypothetical protein